MKRPRRALIGALGWLAFAASGDAVAQTITPVAATELASDNASGPAFRPIADARLRYDEVAQDGQSSTLETIKLRLLAGGEARLSPTLKGLFELEAVEALYDNQRDRPAGSALNTEAFDVNRAQLTWTGLPNTEIVVGRQTIILNNGRFIGNGETRQNDQTFDAVKIVNHGLAPLALTYVYLNAALRPARQISTDFRLDSNSHLLQADIDTALGRLSAYSYLLDFTQAPAQSSASFGLRLTGSRPVGTDRRITYAAEYAHQTSYGSNPDRFGLNYAQIEAGLQAPDWSVTASVERLGGDGERGFLVPLSSEYGFHGWSDTIFNAPPRGLLDFNVKATARIKPLPFGDGLQLTAAAYSLSDADNTQLFGREVDLSASTRLNPHLTVDARAALFDGRGSGYADRATIRIAVRWTLQEVGPDGLAFRP